MLINAKKIALLVSIKRQISIKFSNKKIKKLKTLKNKSKNYKKR
jgi:hypothetical protein